MDKEHIAQVIKPLDASEKDCSCGWYKSDVLKLLNHTQDKHEPFYLDFLRVTTPFLITPEEKVELLKVMPNEFPSVQDGRMIPTKYAQEFYLNAMRRIYRGMALTGLDLIILAMASQSIKTSKILDWGKEEFAKHCLYWAVSESINAIQHETFHLAHSICGLPDDDSSFEQAVLNLFSKRFNKVLCQASV